MYRARKLSELPASGVVKHVNEEEGRIKIAIDPAANGRGQATGEQLIQQYRDLGLDVINADNGVESGLYACWQRFVGGQSKIFQGACASVLEEYRTYQRDEKGKVIKGNDHLMDGALR